MIKVVIADDEIHVRRRLETKIPWQEMGFEAPVFCSDGDELLEELQEHGADLVLTDIRMPRMDGIQAVREARKTLPELAVILMSAYDDKEYLKSALDLRVLGYMEKPFSLQQATELLGRAADSLREKSKKESELGLAKKRRQRDRLTQIARDLCRFQNDYGDCMSALREELPEFCDSPSYYVLLIRRRSQELELTPSEEAARCWQRMEQQSWCGICTGMKQGGAAVLLAETGEGIEQILNQLVQDPDHEGRMIAVGSVVRSPEEIYQSYQDAAVTLERHFYHRSPVLQFEEALGEPMTFSAGEQEGFLFALQSGNAAACRSYLEELRSALKRHDTTLVRTTKNYYFQLALWILQSRAKEREKAVSEYYLWELFYQIGSLDELHQFLLELLKDCLSQDASERQVTSIDEILEYINVNLPNPSLSLAQISREYYMSVTYLCMYFKEKTGTTIKTYMIDRRMKKSAELLAYTDMKVADIADAVGFADQGYFTKSFGKYFGKSPSRYREDAHEKA